MIKLYALLPGGGGVYHVNGILVIQNQLPYERGNQNKEICQVQNLLFQDVVVGKDQ